MEGAKSVDRAYTEHARSVHGVCPECAKNLHGACTEHALRLHWVCTEGAWLDSKSIITIMKIISPIEYKIVNHEDKNNVNWHSSVNTAVMAAGKNTLQFWWLQENLHSSSNIAVMVTAKYALQLWEGCTQIYSLLQISLHDSGNFCIFWNQHLIFMFYV